MVRTRVSLFVWVITFDLPGTWCYTSSVTTASTALRIIWPHKPHHYVKVGILRWGATVTKMFQLSQIFKTKHCISESSSGETAHLKKVPMQNICVSVAYIKWYKTILFFFHSCTVHLEAIKVFYLPMMHQLVNKRHYHNNVSINSYKNCSIVTNTQNKTLHFRSVFRWNHSPEEDTNRKICVVLLT